jgi:hypothetical protein
MPVGVYVRTPDTCRKNAHPYPLGTVAPMAKGYLWVYLENGRKYMHRVVYEAAYGPTSKVVHHIDGDKQNNELSNLQGMTAREHNSLHHRGVSFADSGVIGAL